MVLKQMLEVYDVLDDSRVTGADVAAYLKRVNPDANVEVYAVQGEKGATDMVKVRIPGTNGKSHGGDAPTLGILGRLGGIGARPEVIGFVSDGDGALAALTCAAKLLDMQKKGDCVEGDVFISTQICPHAPVTPHEPVPFMGAPASMAIINREEVSPELDAILSCDTTKGNRILNHRGFAISPTVKEGYILRVSEDLLDLVEITTGRAPVVLPLTMQDITPYGNGIYHLNSILQPATATDAPVVGVAITTESMVPGCASGATHGIDVEETARFLLEVAKNFGRGKCRFYEPEQFERMEQLYGSMKQLQTQGKQG